MDELYALLSEMREEGEKRGQCWVWAAIDPISKLLLAIEVGDRSLNMAQRLVLAATQFERPLAKLDEEQSDRKEAPRGLLKRGSKAIIRPGLRGRG
jgi:hypothetical protein